MKKIFMLIALLLATPVLAAAQSTFSTQQNSQDFQNTSPQNFLPSTSRPGQVSPQESLPRFVPAMSQSEGRYNPDFGTAWKIKGTMLYAAQAPKTWVQKLYESKTVPFKKIASIFK